MALEVARIVLIVLVGSIAFAATLVHSQDQSGFISIDCGLSKDGNYTDATTSLYYVSDEGYVETGVNMDISPTSQSASLSKQLTNVRSFPQGIKNCYTLRPAQGKGTNYLIRASFMYGNYDSKSNSPEFDLHLGTDVWDTVKLDNSSQVIVKEMIYTPTEDYLYVCLADIGLGTPFISMLEVRHLNSTIYNRVSGSLELVHRYYISTTSLDNIRYKDDIFDRLWVPAYLSTATTTSTTSDIDGSLTMFRLPSKAMQTAITPKSNNDPMVLTFSTESSTSQYYIYFHFAELQKLSANETREFNVSVNGALLYGPYSPYYLTSDTIYTTKPLSGSKLSFTFEKTTRSTLPPIVNAMEYFMVKQLSQALTDQQDVNAIMEIKLAYSLSKNWQGDPCVPQSYTWNGVNCTFAKPFSPVITILNLSSSGLTGNITDSFSRLTSLQVLDLSNNSLTGEIPESLAGLPSLTVLNLAGNKLTGSVPQSLLGKSEKGQLTLSTDLCTSSPCAKKKKGIIILVVAAIGALLGLLAVIGVAFLIMRKKAVDYRKFDPSVEQQPVAQQTNLPPQPAYTKNKGGLAGFSYSEVQAMTRDFQRQLGKGGFGAVYYGCLKDGTEVAVKKLYASAHGLDQFETEVELLMAIRHKNLVSLVGYCDEGENLVLIYEFMPSGDLQGILSAEDTPTWRQRLQIAIDASQGLDYLHNGCRPPIVHRDVKTPNILLNENLQAKVADFGLSKIFPDENRSYVSTRVIGTPGYIDPGYYSTQQLNEKTDVYSFGVVLLELITGQPAIIKTETANITLVNKVADMLETGDIWNIVNTRVNESIPNQNSLWRAIDVAMACVKTNPTERPPMSHIVTELKECLAMETASGSQRNYASTTTTTTFDSIEMSASVPMTAMAPMAR